MFQQQYLFWLAGVILLVVAVLSWRDAANPRRFTTGLFWALYGLMFLIGDGAYQLMGQWAGDAAAGKRMLHIGVGIAVVLMALIAGFGGVRLGSYHLRSDQQKRESAQRLRNKLFTSAGVGTAISHLTEQYLAVDNRLIAVAVYAIGMALLTMVMGNAFAAFPIVTAGIGIPILVLQHGGNPAVMAAIGMFSGYCGTLMTPMAANFNIVPARLLELPDRNGVIKAQVPTGVLLLLVNVFLLYFLMFL